MRGRAVTAPDGSRWRVRRVWAPRFRGQTLWSRLRRRMRTVGRRTGDVADAGDPGCAIDLFDDLVLVLAVVVVVLLVVFVVLPLVLVVIDLVLVILLSVLGVIGRVVFRRPWLVEAASSDGRAHTWPVVGWRASGQAIDDLVAALAHGNPLPGHDGTPRDEATGAPADG